LINILIFKSIYQYAGYQLDFRAIVVYRFIWLELIVC
jgi:hypothetical protein